MAEITKVAASYCSDAPPQSATITGKLAGEDIAVGDVCYIKSDDKVWLATGAAGNAAAVAAGFAMQRAYAGDAVTLIDEGNFRYGAALTPGAKYFLSGTVPGGLADAASTGGTKAIAAAIGLTRIRILPGGLW